MNHTPVSESMRFGRCDGAWLIAVVLLHGCLLLIPLKQFSMDTAAPRILTISLPKPTHLETPAAEMPAPEVTLEEPRREISEPRPPKIEQTPEKDPATEQVNRPSAATLFDSASRFNWSLRDKPKVRSLGQPRPYEVPENWRSGIKLEDNLFDGMMAPAETEIVDQWVASDGSRNIVLDTPGGQTLCGRAKAWDPLNPMVPQLMMFRTCGGGGRRSFKMPDRFLKHLVD